MPARFIPRRLFTLAVPVLSSARVPPLLRLKVAPPLAATACPGSTFTLTYEATGTYNVGGFFIPANAFTAQLSDATGDFSAPVELGTVTATTSGTITVTIPPGTPPGTGYRIRVVANSPVTIGEDNGFDITITNDAPTAGFTVSGATTLWTEGCPPTLDLSLRGRGPRDAALGSPRAAPGCATAAFRAKSKVRFFRCILS